MHLLYHNIDQRQPYVAIVPQPGFGGDDPIKEGLVCGTRLSFHLKRYHGEEDVDQLEGFGAVGEIRRQRA